MLAWHLVLGGAVGYAMTYKEPAKKKLSRGALLATVFGTISFIWPYIFGW